VTVNQFTLFSGASLMAEKTGPSVRNVAQNPNATNGNVCYGNGGFALPKLLVVGHLNNFRPRKMCAKKNFFVSGVELERTATNGNEPQRSATHSK